MTSVANDTQAATQAAIMDALRTVYDPCCAEKQISVVDMGLIEEVVFEGDGARIDLVLTSGWCPFALDLLTMIKEAVERVPAIGTADVDIRWETAWATERLSESARRKLRFLPPPNVANDARAFAGRMSSTNGAPS